MNQYKNDPIDFKPSKLYFENENEMIDEFCRHCCGYIPTNNEGDNCYSGCNELIEMISDYSANFENDRSGISKIIDSQQSRITELESKLRWIPVSERLPDRDGMYEVLYCGKHYKMLFFCVEFGWANVSDSEKITHYRKVPEL